MLPKCPLIREVILALPREAAEGAVGPPRLEWWSRDDEASHRAVLNALSFREPWMPRKCGGTLRSGAAFKSRLAGPTRTLELIEAADSSEQQVAIVQAGVAFQLVGSARRAWVALSAGAEAAWQAYAQELYAKAGFTGGRPAWRPVHTCVLPVSAEGAPPDAEEQRPAALLAALERRIAAVQREVESRWRPVRVRGPVSGEEAERARQAWLESPMRELLREQALARNVEHGRSATQAARRARRMQAAHAEELQARRQRHPRWGEWRGLATEELKQLVWRKQLTALAQEFGVSDTAIRKRCDDRGIERPPQGYWLRGDRRQTA